MVCRILSIGFGADLPVIRCDVWRPRVGPYGLSVLLTVWVGICIVLEIPSGALADRVSRKRLLVASTLSQACAYLVWLASQSFPGYLVGFVLWGMADVLASGTTESLLFDALTAFGDTDIFTKVYGRIKALDSLAAGQAMLLWRRLDPVRVWSGLGAECGLPAAFFAGNRLCHR